MARKILITLDGESEKVLVELVQKGNSNMSKVVRGLILSKQTSDKERSVLACVRDTERYMHVMLGVLNSLVLGFPTLTDAPYQDPDEHKHEILRGAERSENAKIRKRMQSRNFNRNGEGVNE